MSEPVCPNCKRPWVPWEGSPFITCPQCRKPFKGKMNPCHWKVVDIDRDMRIADVGRISNQNRTLREARDEDDDDGAGFDIADAAQGE